MHSLLEEEPCPVSDEVLGAIYRANSYGLDSVVLSVPAEVRAMLALYCSRRGHLQTIALAIAAGREEYELITVGGQAGAMLFEQARHAPVAARPHNTGRKKISLSTGMLRKTVEDEGVFSPPAFDENLLSTHPPL